MGREPDLLLLALSQGCLIGAVAPEHEIVRQTGLSQNIMPHSSLHFLHDLRSRLFKTRSFLTPSHPTTHEQIQQRRDRGTLPHCTSWNCPSSSTGVFSHPSTNSQKKMRQWGHHKCSQRGRIQKQQFPPGAEKTKKMETDGQTATILEH